MSAREREVPSEVLAVLSGATVDGVVVTLPAGQLDRKLYQAVDAVLRDMGGKWKTRVGHVFPEDPSDRLDAVILTGRITSPACNGYFPTPVPLVRRLMELSEIEHGMTVLEPSAGQGHIADHLREQTDAVHVVELLPDNRAVLATKGYEVAAEDFLSWAPETLYDRVVMNPPFAKQQDIAHVTKAHSHLKPGGRLVAIMSAGVVFRQDQKARNFRALMGSCGGWHEANPEGSFRESGTDVNTVIVVLCGAA